MLFLLPGENKILIVVETGWALACLYGCAPEPPAKDGARAGRPAALPNLCPGQAAPLAQFFPSVSRFPQVSPQL